MVTKILMRMGRIVLFPITLAIALVIIILAIIIHPREIFQRLLKGQINYNITLTHQDKHMIFNVAKGFLLIIVGLIFIIFLFKL